MLWSSVFAEKFGNIFTKGLLTSFRLRSINLDKRFLWYACLLINTGRVTAVSKIILNIVWRVHWSSTCTLRWTAADNNENWQCREMSIKWVDAKKHMEFFNSLWRLHYYAFFIKNKAFCIFDIFQVLTELFSFTETNLTNFLTLNLLSFGSLMLSLTFLNNSML